MSDEKEKEEKMEEKVPGGLGTEGWTVGSGRAQIEDRTLKKRKKRSKDEKEETPGRGVTFSIDITPSDKG